MGHADYQKDPTKEPKKRSWGRTSIYLGVEYHKQLVAAADNLDLKLNDLMLQALAKYVPPTKPREAVQVTPSIAVKTSAGRAPRRSVPHPVPGSEASDIAILYWNTVVLEAVAVLQNATKSMTASEILASMRAEIKNKSAMYGVDLTPSKLNVHMRTRDSKNRFFVFDEETKRYRLMSAAPRAFA